MRTSPISGLGTFAKQKIARGKYICTLTGEAFTYDFAEKVCLKRGIDFDDALQVDDDVMILLDEAARVINHSCNPNAGLRNRNDLYAIRDININDEITYDYSTTANAAEVWKMTCRCGAKSCRGIVGNVLSLPPQVLHKYMELNALPDYIKRQFDRIVQSLLIPG